MVADVPVGAFLSGASTRRPWSRSRGSRRHRPADHDAPLRGVSRPATTTKRRWRRSSRASTAVATRPRLSLTDFRAELPRIFAAMDQPTVDGLNSYFISKAAAEMGLKVALSGDGGDELFGGYTSFRDIPRWMPFTSVLSRVPGLGEGVYRLNTALARRSRHISPKMGEILRHGSSYAGAYLVKRGRFLATELPEVLGDDVAREGLRRLDLISSGAPSARSRHALRARRGARVVALLRITAARHGLGQPGPLAGMRVPLVDRTCSERSRRARDAERARQAAPRDAPRPRSRTSAARGANRFTLPIRDWLTQEGAWSSASGAGRARCTTRCSPPRTATGNR